MHCACGFMNLDQGENGARRGFVKKLVSVRRQPKNINNNKKKKQIYIGKKTRKLSVGLPCCRMFCVAKTFLLCMVFFVICLKLLYVLLLETFLKCLILRRNAPPWRVCTHLENEDTNKSNFQEWLLSLLRNYAPLTSKDQSLKKKKKRFSTCLIMCGKLLFSCCNNRFTVLSKGALGSKDMNVRDRRVDNRIHIYIYLWDIIWVPEEMEFMSPDRYCGKVKVEKSSSFAVPLRFCCQFWRHITIIKQTNIYTIRSFSIRLLCKMSKTITSAEF